MKFTLHEIKLWFNDETAKPKSYEFLPNKINVITGDATTGKTSLWSIIDYCLMSGLPKIANTVNELVSWYGIKFTINDNIISIARRSSKAAVSSDVYLNIGVLPSSEPTPNSEVSEIKTLLDMEFGVTDNLRFPLGKSMGATKFNLSYRHFLLFNSLTEDIIGTSKTYFDTTFYGKEEFDKALPNIFNLIIGVNGMQNIKAIERIQEIDRELNNIKEQSRKKSKSEKQFENDIFALIEELKVFNFLDPFLKIASLDQANSEISGVILNMKKLADNSKLFTEIDNLEKRQSEIVMQLSAIESYHKQYDLYKKTLHKTADSLLPIEFLKKNLLDQLLESYESTVFIKSLEDSLKNIQLNLSRKAVEPLKVTGDAKMMRQELVIIKDRIIQLNKIKTDFISEGEKFIKLGEVKNEFDQINKRIPIKPLDTNRLNHLTVEKSRLEGNVSEIGEVKFTMKSSLNKSIQRNYNLLTSLPTYKNHETSFNDSQMVMQLKPAGELFPLENVGSKSNYMFMHLCFYLGLHEHMITVGQNHVPQFLFIDQPSIPYYSGNSGGNDDKSKLIDAFSLINSFIDYITIEKNETFQIFMVEHAPKEYWTENNLLNFHTVDEFNNGKGLIPSEIYNN